MLETLRISNYAIIESIGSDFQPGMTAITGETGAGKSILLGALKLILGERATAESVRAGAPKASVEAVFGALPREVMEYLETNGLADADDEQLIIRREIQAGGTSRNFINNRAATLAQLRDLAPLLIDLHGQNEHTSLFAQAVQLTLLDSFGGHQKALDKCSSAYRNFKEAEAKFEKLSTGFADAEKRRQFLQFQIEEIGRAALAAGEDEELESERRRLANAEKLGEDCETACDLLYEGERVPASAASIISTATKALAELAALDPSQEQLAKDAEALRFSAEDLCARIRSYASSVAADPQRLAYVDERLHTIRGLKKKYGATVGEIVSHYDALTAELDSIENFGANMAASQADLNAASEQLAVEATALTSLRRKAAKTFEKRVAKEMAELELPKAAFSVSLSKADFGPTGADAIEFLISLNPGEETRPLRKVASGGEISRIMLAIKAVLAEKDQVPCLIFDEIDVGISGDAAARVGEKLALLGQSHQVLCITHLPQVAAHAGAHLVVEKSVTQNRTQVSLVHVSENDRAAALARMLSGREADETSQRYAEKLLSKQRATAP